VRRRREGGIEVWVHGNRGCQVHGAGAEGCMGGRGEWVRHSWRDGCIHGRTNSRKGGIDHGRIKGIDALWAEKGRQERGRKAFAHP
jgi:hypothetical protein